MWSVCKKADLVYQNAKTELGEKVKNTRSVTVSPAGVWVGSLKDPEIN